MILASYVAGSTALAIIPLLFLVARHWGKRSRGLSWSFDDTLLALALVPSTTGGTLFAVADLPSDVPIFTRNRLLRQQVPTELFPWVTN